MSTSVKENVVKMIDQIAQQNPEAIQTFSQVISDKVAAALENLKVDAAQQMFGQQQEETKE